MTEYIQKGALETKNYQLDWSTKGLGTDTIASAAMTAVPNGLTLSGVSGSGTLSNFTVAGGSAGLTYTLTATINTTAGQEFQETVYCFVEP